MNVFTTTRNTVHILNNVLLFIILTYYVESTVIQGENHTYELINLKLLSLVV